MKWRDYIDSDPTICHGQPCFKVHGKLSRIMVYIVLEMLEAGESFRDITKAYSQLTEEHIKAALHYAAEIIKAGEPIPLAEIS